MDIRQARVDEYERILEFYNDVLDGLENAQYHPRWQKGIYPTEASLRTAIENKQLYVGLVGTGMVAAMVFNHEFNEGYKHVSWMVDASDDKVFMIHLLCVHPKVKRRGLAKEMVCWAIEEAKRQHMKAIRLDVLKGNVPAEKLYPSLGFKYITTERTYYDDLDWMDFLVYECPLENVE